MRNTVKSHVSRSLYTLLMKQDFQSYMKAIERLQFVFDNQYEDFIGIFDLIIKWLFLIMHQNNNTKLSKAALHFTKNILEELIAQDYTFLENESHLLLEFLMKKLHHNIEVIGINALTNLFLMQKIFSSQVIFEKMIQDI